MTTIYFKDASGRKVAVTVTEDVAAADKETRRAGWRSDAMERFHRDPKLHDFNDHDEEIASEETNPEIMHIAAEDKAERRMKLTAALKELTPKQLRLVKMLRAGLTVTDIAAKLKCSKPTISKMKKAIQKIFESFL